MWNPIKYVGGKIDALNEKYFDNTITQIISEFEGNWPNPSAVAVEGFKKRLKEEGIPHKFSVDDYVKLGETFEKWLPYMFDLPETPWDFTTGENPDWQSILSGAENVKPLLGKENTKIIYLVFPHNSHFDESLLPISLYKSGLGDVRTFARSNMFKFKPLGDKLRVGAFTGAIYEKAPKEMLLCADEAITEYIEETLLPEANKGEIQGEAQIPVYGNLLAYGVNGRSYDGLVKHLSTRIAMKFMKLQYEHPEWDIQIVPIVNTMTSAIEQDAFPKLVDLKNMEKENKKKYPLRYFKRDYGTIIAEARRRKKNPGKYPLTEIFHDVKAPISLKDYAVDPADKQLFKKRRDELNEVLDKTMRDGYRIHPIKLVADVIYNSFIKQKKDINMSELDDLVKRQYHQYVSNRFNAMAPENDSGLILPAALEHFQQEGTVKGDNNNIKIVKPDRIKYQANTIKHQRDALG